MIIRALLSSFILLLLFNFSACDSSDDPAVNEKDRVTALLVGNSTIGSTWILNDADVDGVNYFDEFEGLTITFNEGGGLIAENGKELFDASDSWELNDAATQLTRGDGLVIDINEITNDQLVLEFVVDETIFGSGRSESVAGTNTLTFGRQ